MNILGFDIGTTGISGVLLDKDSGEVVRKAFRKNDSAFSGELPEMRLQNADRILTLASEILSELSDGASPVSIGATGQMHGIVYIDKDGKPLSPLATWQDERGNLLYRDGESYVAYMQRVSGYSLASGYGAVTLFYDTVNGKVPKNATAITTIHSLAVGHISGSFPVLHPSDAASFGLYDLEAHDFDREAIRALGMDPDLFPKVVDDGTVCGKTVNGIPVTVAIGDNQASVFGSLTDPDASILVNVGTGSQISCVVPRRIADPAIDCRPFFEGKYLIAGSSLCGGRAYAILAAFFADVARAFGIEKSSSPYAAMDALIGNDAEKSPLTVDTTFGGTRKDPNRSGSITGIRTDNLTMKNLCAGTMDGMVTELLDLYRLIRKFLDGDRKILVGSGNGIRVNPSLRARFERDFGLPVQVPTHTEEAAFGAALFGAFGAGVYSSLKEAQNSIHYER